MVLVILNVLLSILTFLLSVPVVVVVIQVLLAVLFGRSRSNSPLAKFTSTHSRPAVAVVVPAHNESVGLRPTLDSVRQQLNPGDQFIVVADNCSDDTAQVCKDAGVTVLERHDTEKRGKGFALDFGVRSLEQNPPAYVVFCDADVTLRSGTLDELIWQAQQTRRPAQGIYVLYPSKDHADVASYIAVLIKNHVRPLGWRLLGGPCTCTGAGIAFDYSTAKQLPLASGNIVEDMAMSFDLAHQGKAALLCPTAFIDGELAPSSQSADKQRRRWGHGHLQTIASYAFPSLFSFRLQKMALGLDVCVFPLTLLLGLLFVWIVVCVVVALTTSVSIGFAIHTLTLFLVLCATVVVGYLTFDSAPGKLRKLSKIPAYMLGKIMLYLGFFGNRERAWNRTDRAQAPKP
jgi:cellulose synthase/poly-beta-1,6-N-acetylglucosamine synthase-like glycosyltransferase